MKAIDLTGQHFGRLVAIEYVGNNTNRNALWRCACDCGTETVVISRHLRTGNTRSCGCLHDELQAARCTTRNAREVIGYTGAHRRVWRVRGAPSDYPCLDCTADAQEWSYGGGDPQEQIDPKGRPFSFDPHYYEPRCRRCHRRHDWHRKNSPAPPGAGSVATEGAHT